MPLILKIPMSTTNPARIDPNSLLFLAEFAERSKKEVAAHTKLAAASEFMADKKGIGRIKNPTFHIHPIRTSIPMARTKMAKYFDRRNKMRCNPETGCGLTVE